MAIFSSARDLNSLSLEYAALLGIQHTFFLVIEMRVHDMHLISQNAFLAGFCKAYECVILLESLLNPPVRSARGSI